MASLRSPKGHVTKISFKHYKCKECGHEKEINTNHYGECYSLGTMNACPGHPVAHGTVWEFAGELPEGAWVPEPWTKHKLGDLLEEIP